MKFWFMFFCILVSSNSFAFQTIYIVRHAEKLDDSRDPGLSLKGKIRALKLAAHLRDSSVKAIFTSEYQRTQKTAEPLAELLQIPSTVGEKDTAKFAAQLLADKSSDAALVVGHSNTVVELVRALGVPVKWELADTEFDRLVTVTLSKPTSVASFIRYFD